MTIRPAAAEDLPSIAALYFANHRSSYRGLLPDEYLSALSPEACLEKWSAALQRADETVWAAYDEIGFLGFAAGAPDPELAETWYLESLHVAEAARGRGVGSALIREAARRAGEAGFRRMSVCIVRGNERAGALYRKLGAVHLCYFEDRFGTAVSSSEKLLWERLPK